MDNENKGEDKENCITGCLVAAYAGSGTIPRLAAKDCERKRRAGSCAQGSDEDRADPTCLDAFGIRRGNRQTVGN